MTIHDSGQIDDEHDPSIPQNGSSTDQVGGHSLIIKGLDHEFFFAFEAIHNQTELTFTQRNDQYKNLPRLFRPTITPPSESYQRQDPIAELQNFVVVYLVHVRLSGARDFRNGIERDGVQPLLYPKEQSFDDRQSERQLESESCTLARSRLQIHRTLQPVQHGLDNVQANTAPRDLGDLFRRAKAGFEYERENARLAQPLRFFRRNESLLQGL